jgi:choline dehydrogenase
MIDTGFAQKLCQAYYEPASHRENLIVLCEATATKLKLIDVSNEGLGLVRAVGVHFVHQDKVLYADVAREVIVSAGSICSPQLLELSGK